MVTTRPKTQTSVPKSVWDISVVVPCFNEESGLQQLHDRLSLAMDRLRGATIQEVVLVDDGSDDATWERLCHYFGNQPWAKLVRHDHNKGITAAIRTGVEASNCEWVATIDADCTYEPMQLQQLTDLIDNQVAMVTASPYHPDGQVVGVPRWRLALSKLASAGYRLLLSQKLHTYTSCFRIYRKEIWSQLPVTNGGFVGVAEIAWQIDRAGGRIIEAPAVLTTRKIGFSKMKTLPVIRQHLTLMSRILMSRIFCSRVLNAKNRKRSITNNLQLTDDQE